MCALVNLLKFKKEQCEVLQLVQGNSTYQYRLGDEWIESNPAKEDIRVLVFEELGTMCQGALAAQKVNHILDCMKKAQQAEDGGSPL